MCGIAGILKRADHVVDEVVINKMIKTLTHRGPNDQGVWCSGSIGLAHARLSIHDLSKAGHQPMFSLSQRFVIVFNGEIYNYLTMKKNLEKQHRIKLMGNSDTEVLVHAIECWGLEKTLAQCQGMFAFALWDRKEQLLYLARDRFGEKPLYYGLLGEDFVFASELKAIQANYRAHLHINRQALTSYLRYGYVPTPNSIYQHLFKLKAGHYLVVNRQQQSQCRLYWQAQDAVFCPKFCGTFEQAVDELEEKLKQSLPLYMAADVPLGAFLSGGIDSSIIVALMQSLSSKKIQTFSIGFGDPDYNEAPYAKAVADHLKTHHTELYVTERDALEVIPKLAQIYDEPFADSSQIPTFLVSQLAKSQVSVSLSGDGGDELFGGYQRYFLAQKVKEKIIDRPLAKALLTHAPMGLLKLLTSPIKRYRRVFDQLMKLRQIVTLGQSSKAHFYQQLCSQIYAPESLVIDGSECENDNRLAIFDHPTLSFQEKMMLCDTKTYLMDDILTKVDRAAMALSLETRMPFLNHHLYAFAWSLPLEYKIQNGGGKRVLRALLSRYLPKHLIERPKMGFAIPLAAWLKGHLKDWAKDLLNPIKIKQQGYLHADVVLRYWQEHQTGKQNWSATLWTILMFQAWVATLK